MSTPIPAPPNLAPIRGRLDAIESEGISPSAFGATGDGETDDTIALQEALNAATAARRPILSGSSIYRITSTLELPSNAIWIGRGTVIRPDGFNAPVARAQGVDGAPLENISISGLRIDGANRPADSSGGFGAFHFAHVTGLTVRDIQWRQAHDGLFLRAVQGFTVAGLRAVGLNSALVACLKDTRLGSISDLAGEDINELVDFSVNEDIAVTNFAAIGNGLGEGFDMGNSRRITISNGILRGFDRGVLVKTEPEVAEPGSTSWEDLTFSDLLILEHATEGMTLQAAAAGYGEARRIRVSNVRIISTKPGAEGISLTPPISGAGGTDATFDRVLVDVPGESFFTHGWSGVRVRDSRLKTGAGIALHFFSSPHPDLVVRNNEIETTGGAAADAAIFAAEADDVVIEGNRITTAVSGYAVRVRNSKRPIVRKNVVAGAAGHGIFLDWSDMSKADVLKLASIEGNIVRDWGQAATFRRAITIQASSAVNVEGLSVVGNEGVLSAGAAVQSQIGFIAEFGSASLSRCRLDGNTIGSLVPTPFHSSASTFFGVGCSKANNLPAVP